MRLNESLDSKISFLDDYQTSPLNEKSVDLSREGELTDLSNYLLKKQN